MKQWVTFVSNRLGLVVVIYIASLLLAASLFSVVEHKTYFESLWWASVTSLTIGYGDITPVTTLGRVIGIIFGHFWIFTIIPTIVANIVVNLIENKDAFTDSEQKELMNKIDILYNKLVDNK